MKIYNENIQITSNRGPEFVQDFFLKTKMDFENPNLYTKKEIVYWLTDEENGKIIETRLRKKRPSIKSKMDFFSAHNKMHKPMNYAHNIQDIGLENEKKRERGKVLNWLNISTKKKKIIEPIDISRSSIPFRNFINNYLRFELPIKFMETPSILEDVERAIQNYHKPSIQMELTKKDLTLVDVEYQKLMRAHKNLTNFIKADFPYVSIITHIGSATQKIIWWLEKFTDFNHTFRENTSFENAYEKLTKSNNESVDIYVATEKNLELFPERAHYLHMAFFCNDHSVTFNQRLKFAFLLSGTFFFHMNFWEIPSFIHSGFYQIQSLLITSLRLTILYNDEKPPLEIIKTKIVFHLYETWALETDNLFIRTALCSLCERAWYDALEYLDLDPEDLGSVELYMYGFYDFLEMTMIILDPFQTTLDFSEKHDNLMTKEEYGKVLDQNYQDNIPEKIYIMFNLDHPSCHGQFTSRKDIEQEECRETLSKYNFSNNIIDAWIRSQIVDFIPMGRIDIPINCFTKKLYSFSVIELFFDRLVFSHYMLPMLEEWYSMTEKGIYIKDINKALNSCVNFIQKKVLWVARMLKNEDRKYPFDVSEDVYFSKYEAYRMNVYSKKLWSFFERHLKKIWFFQIRMLQYKCSVIFKEKILKLFLEEPLHWETGHNKAITECEELFMKSAADFKIPLINKTLNFAKNELIDALKDYFVELKESPARELNALDKIEKNINRSKSKSKQMIVGFALTTAVRLRGYGNFQLVSSYAHGPHVFNFSCINDKSTLENETKGYVKPVRIQPSLNFDIRL